jgi:hypothetical protein
VGAPTRAFPPAPTTALQAVGAIFLRGGAAESPLGIVRGVALSPGGVLYVRIGAFQLKRLGEAPSNHWSPEPHGPASEIASNAPK